MKTVHVSVCRWTAVSMLSPRRGQRSALLFLLLGFSADQKEEKCAHSEPDPGDSIISSL